MKDELIVRLRQLDWDGIIAMAQADKKVVRTLLKLLYHPDDYIHWLAAEAIGKYGSSLALENPEKTRELVRRLLWNLNEECGASPWGSVEAIAAITAEQPDLFANYVSILFPFHEDESLLPGVIWVQAQVGRRDPGAVAMYIPFLIGMLRHSSPAIRAYAAWALGEIQAREAVRELQDLLGDGTEVALYDRGGVYRTTTVARIAQSSLEVLQNHRL